MAGDSARPRPGAVPPFAAVAAWPAPANTTNSKRGSRGEKLYCGEAVRGEVKTAANSHGGLAPYERVVKFGVAALAAAGLWAAKSAGSWTLSRKAVQAGAPRRREPRPDTPDLLLSYGLPSIFIYLTSVVPGFSVMGLVHLPAGASCVSSGLELKSL